MAETSEEKKDAGEAKRVHTYPLIRVCIYSLLNSADQLILMFKLKKGSGWGNLLFTKDYLIFSLM